MGSCGTCQKFKGDGQFCGQTYPLGGKMMKYTPMNEKVGPCREGYVKKKEELVPLSVPATEHSVLLARRCGDCQKYKGPHVRCGEAFSHNGSAAIYYTPYGENAHGCTDEKFVPKKDMMAFAIKVFDEGYIYKPEVQPLTAPIPMKLSDVRAHYKQTTTKKETSNMHAIIRLADSQLNKQIEDFGGLSLDIREALEGMQAEEKKQAAATAAREVMTLLKAGQLVITENVNSINIARRQEKAAKDRIESINRATAYGKETSNFVPLGILTGHLYAHHIENEALRTVPKDWEPKPAEGQPVAAA